MMSQAIATRGIGCPVASPAIATRGVACTPLVLSLLGVHDGRVRLDAYQGLVESMYAGASLARYEGESPPVDYQGVAAMSGYRAAITLAAYEGISKIMARGDVVLSDEGFARILRSAGDASVLYVGAADTDDYEGEQD